MFNRQINFVGKSPIFGAISGLLMLASLVIFLTIGLNYGIDFAGGTELQIKFGKPTTAGEIRDALVAINMGDARVQSFGDPKDYEFLVRVSKSSVDPSRFDDKIKLALQSALGSANSVVRTRYVGDKAYVKLQAAAAPATLSQALANLGISELVVHDVNAFGKVDDHEYVVNFSGVSKTIVTALQGKFGADSFEMRREDTVGPKVGKELRTKGVMAILVSLILLLIYVAFRFDFTFAPGAIFCLFHDVVVTMGIFCFMRMEVDLTVLAAMLTLVGYSLNDTIVVYDRIRENMKKMQGADFAKIINVSINQTLSRTLMTSGATMLVTLALLIAGGEILYNFAFALTFGIIVGSYSTIYIASPIAILINKMSAKKA